MTSHDATIQTMSHLLLSQKSVQNYYFFLIYTNFWAKKRILHKKQPPNRLMAAFFCLNNPPGSPQAAWASGESGDSGRPNNDGVVGQCDPLVEREYYSV
jgi:hypothetical protein